MAQVKASFLKRYNKLLAYFVSILGFTACDSIVNTKTLYGMPTADYKVSGSVISSETKEAIPNIQVVMQYDTVSTDANGNYQIEIRDGVGLSFILEFEDVDGTQHGEFEAKETSLDFENAEYVGGDGSWYHGTTSKEVDVELDPKK